MKIALVNNYFYLRGGAEKVFFEEIDLLQRNNHEVIIFSRKHPQNYPYKYDNFFPPFIQTEKIMFNFEALKTLKEIIYSFKAKKMFKKFLLHFRPDLIHVHNIYGRLTTSILDVGRELGYPLVMTLHDYKIVCPNYKLMKNGKICEECRGKNFYNAVRYKCHKNSYIASFIYAFESYFNYYFGKYKNNIDFFISPSKFLKDKIIQFQAIEKEKIVYIPNFIVPKLYEPCFKYENYILYVGRLSEEKGIDILIKAFKKIKKKNNHKLIIIGEGNLKEKLAKEADSNVVFTGYLRGEKLKSFFQNCKALVLPSVCYENAPMVILEAFAYGKPVIGSNLGGIKEMIEDNTTGYLFETGNVEDLKDKIEQMLCIPIDKLKNMGKEARHIVEERYSDKAHYKKLMEIYQRCLK